MSEAYARSGLEQATADRAIVLAISIFSAVLVIAGLFYATGTSARHRAALAARLPMCKVRVRCPYA